MMPVPPAYCSVCGNPLVTRFLAEEGRERQVCDACSHIHYVNPLLVAGVIPVSAGGIWLLRRAIAPRIGYWTFPAGYMELGETVEQAAERETREELNLSVRLVRLLTVYSRPDLRTVHVVYLGEALSGAEAGSEALECRLFGRDAIPWDDLAFSSTYAALSAWAAEETS
jgi:ADP-ribose pyrophosphatase YjhB (NUDIX family)